MWFHHNEAQLNYNYCPLCALSGFCCVVPPMATAPAPADVSSGGVLQSRATARMWGLRAKRAKEAAEDQEIAGKAAAKKASKGK